MVGSWNHVCPRVGGPIHVICALVFFTDEDIKVQRRQGTFPRPHSSGHRTLAGTGCAHVGPFKVRGRPLRAAVLSALLQTTPGHGRTKPLRSEIVCWGRERGFTL